MTAEVEKQSVLDVSKMAVRQAYRAVCWGHPLTDRFIAPWMGETYVIEPGKASYYNAALDAKIHNLKEHDEHPN